jgi:Mg/Co/Ni transporter MgtE
MIVDIVHVQHMPRQEMVETLVQRQHLADLKNLLQNLPAEEIAVTLEALEKDSAIFVWSQIPQELAINDLWEVSNSCHEQLVSDRASSFGESRLCACVGTVLRPTRAKHWLQGHFFEGRF